MEKYLAISVMSISLYKLSCHLINKNHKRCCPTWEPADVCKRNSLNQYRYMFWWLAKFRKEKDDLVHFHCWWKTSLLYVVRDLRVESVYIFWNHGNITKMMRLWRAYSVRIHYQRNHCLLGRVINNRVWG